MDYALNINIGIISGIATSAILYTLLLLIKNVLNPWLKKLLYHGIDLSGRWYCSDYRMAQEVTIDLSQSANKITGTATFISKNRPSSHQFEDIRSFSVSGNVKDRFINLTLNNIDSKRLGITNYLLEAVGDGRCLEGVLSFYGLHQKKVIANQQKLWRDKAQADLHYNREEQEHLSRIRDQNIHFLETPDEDEDEDENENEDCGDHEENSEAKN